MSVMSQGVNTFFSGESIVATSFTYSDSEKCKAEEIVVQVGVPTLTATSLTYRIEGLFPSATRWAEIYSEKVTAETTVDKLINITERVQYMRVGAKIVNVTATPNNFYCSVNLTEYK